MLRNLGMSLTVATGLLWAGAGMAQEERLPEERLPEGRLAARQSGPRVQSPLVNADQTITFSILAPDARAISAAIWTPPTNTTVELKKDGKGLWRGTSPVMAPDLYYYHLNVDGVVCADPGATWFKGHSKDLMCMVEVPGKENPVWRIRDGIDHGALTHHLFNSKASGGVRGLNVYTPPSYYKSNKKYPVLYLLHGAGGDETRWVDVGLIDRILDNWIAEGKIAELVVAITSNRVGGGPAAEERAPANALASAPAPGASILEGYFLQEILPFVESHYRVDKDKEKTAVAGFSMGGAQSLQLALNHPDRFGALASLSGAIHRADIMERYPVLKDAKQVNKEFPVLYVVCGEHDALNVAAKTFHEQLAKAGINHKYLTGPGGHAYKVDWPMMEKFLHDFTMER